MTIDETVLYDEIIERGIATDRELHLARCLIDGTWEDVMNKVIYIWTGYHNMRQLIDDEG